jgi:hypothetical protein
MSENYFQQRFICDKSLGPVCPSILVWFPVARLEQMMRILRNGKRGARQLAVPVTTLLAAIVCCGGEFGSTVHGAGWLACFRVEAPILIPPVPPTFEAIAPAEFHVAANRQVARSELTLRNTTRCQMILATLCCKHWRCGLVPGYTIEFPEAGDGPIVRDSVKLDLAALSGNQICPGMHSCSVPIEFKLKPDLTAGSKETFRVKMTLTNPFTNAVQTTDWAVDVVIRPSGLPLLTSEKIPFPSEGK